MIAVILSDEVRVKHKNYNRTILLDILNDVVF